MKRILMTAAAAILVCGAAGGAQAKWLESWGAAPLPPSPAGGFFGASPSFENQTVRQVVRLSAGGDRIRIQITNEYGTAPLHVGAASVALADDSGAPVGAPVPVTFSGAQSGHAAAGAPLVSDPVILSADPLQTLSINLYFPDPTGPCTCHLTGAQTAYVSGAGDFTAEGVFEPASAITQRLFLGGVDVWAADSGWTLVTLGDSITDGVGATTDGNDRWPDILAARLAARGGAPAAVSNQGISGNRLLAGGMGDPVLARLDRDVFGVPGAAAMILFIGVNDLGQAFGAAGNTARPGLVLPAGVPVSAQSMIAGYRQVIARAHAQGIRVIGATIAPYKGATYWTEEGEVIRQTINDWIRDGGEFDGVADFDAAVRDPADSARMADGLHMGDFLHGSPAGYAAMAEAVDLSLFD